MAVIILVRHGQTEFNRTDRFRGRLDVPLNETGLRQADMAAAAIRARYEVEAVYSSPLSRAVKTAEPIAWAFGLPVRILPGVGDFGYGDWEGRSFADVQAAYPEQYDLYLHRPHLARIPGAGSLLGLRRRASRAVEQVAELHPSGTAVMVSHRMVCRVLVCYLLGLGVRDLPRVELETASISVFEKRDDGWTALLIGDTCHLG